MSTFLPQMHIYSLLGTGRNFQGLRPWWRYEDIEVLAPIPLCTVVCCKAWLEAVSSFNFKWCVARCDHKQLHIKVIVTYFIVRSELLQGVIKGGVFTLNWVTLIPVACISAFMRFDFYPLHSHPSPHRPIINDNVDHPVYDYTLKGIRDLLTRLRSS